MSKFYVYVIYDPRDSIPIYVGKGRRAYEHLNGAENPILEKVRKKIESLGLKLNFKIIARFESEAEAFAKERERVAFYGRRNLKRGLLCNLTDGGDGMSGLIMPPGANEKRAAAHRGKKRSPEARAKMSEAQRGKKKHSQEVRAKMRETRRGENHHLFGKKHSPEVCQKIRVTLLGRKPSPEEVANHCGWKHSSASRAKISAAGRGRIFTQETIAKRVATRARNKSMKKGKSK
jgi:NUMOD3 motif